MEVIKRSGRREPVKFDKISARIKKLCYGLDPKYVSVEEIAKKVITGIYDGVKTTELDNLAAETSASMASAHPEYATLAARIAISNLHKSTKKNFFMTMKELHKYIDPVTGQKAALISDETFEVIKKNKDLLNSTIIYDRDYSFDYFGFKTLERSYLMRLNGEVVERPQHMFMRVAIGIHGEDIESAIETYDLMSQKWFIHATPTLFNAGTPKPQLSSCFLLTMEEDSIEGIFNTLTQCAKISQSAGGIGLSVHNIRSKGSYIKGTGGYSNGLVPMLRVFNDTARYVDQCFHPDTIVYTKNGIKQIDQISLGEELLTDSNEFNRVSRVMHQAYKGKMHQIGVKQSIEPIEVTPEHIFLVLRNQKKTINFNIIRNRLEKGLIEPEWVEAKNLTEDDLIAFPYSNYEADIYEYNLDDCRFYGMMLGDGHVAKNGKAAHITMNKATDDTNFVRRYLYESGIHYTISEEGKKIRFTWSAHLGFKFNRNMLYDANSEKQFHPSMLHLPKEKSLQIIKGLIEADGCISNRENYEISLEMTSRNVIESVRFILMRFGILTSGYKRDRVGNVSSYKNITTQKVSWCLRIPKVSDITNLFDLTAGKYVNYFTHNNCCYARVNCNEVIDYDGIVVDFEVEPQHNYVTHVGTAHNGGGKRKGAFAIYLEPWHSDVREFLDLKKNHGKEEMRARDLFYAMWIPDLFMERVKSDGQWSMFCPNECPGLYDAYGTEFNELYTKYEREGKARETIKAQELWFAILESQIETGTPYMLYKDAANQKSNQKNLGTIRSSNLCTEILEYTSKDEVAVCNLASIALPKFVENGEFQFDQLFKIAKRVTRNLNKIIDVNYYPIKEARNSNMRHRPIGIGVQGLADAFILMRFAFDSAEARKLNQDIFETIYYGALTASVELAKEEGTYETFEGSPASEGILQFDMWGVTPSDRWDWDSLKAEIKEHGIRNSLLLAPMPTASTSQILGNNECFEPYTSNIYTRRTLSGEFIVVNNHLLKDLIKLNMWNEEVRTNLIANNGSIQHIDGLPQTIKDLYKTTWEIKQKAIIDMAADRGAFICQSQSMNVHLESANFAKLSSMHFYAWQKGLKTGMYYLRTRPASEPIKFTVDAEFMKKQRNTEIASLNNKQQEQHINEKPLAVTPVANENGIALEPKQEYAQPSIFNNSGPVTPIEEKVEMKTQMDMFSQDDIAKIKACSLDDPDCESCSA